MPTAMNRWDKLQCFHVLPGPSKRGTVPPLAELQAAGERQGTERKTMAERKCYK